MRSRADKAKEKRESELTAKKPADIETGGPKNYFYFIGKECAKKLQVKSYKIHVLVSLKHATCDLKQLLLLSLHKSQLFQNTF